jgi:hypothetical protein
MAGETGFMVFLYGLDPLGLLLCGMATNTALLLMAIDTF